MSLPWVRLDTALASHDKILALLSDASPKRYQAAFSYACALGWCGDHGTDGYVPPTALPFVHGTKVTAALLEKHRLWLPDMERPGWYMPNYALRQELSVVTEAKRAAQRIGGRKGNCRRYHGPECTCWMEESA